MLGLIFFYGVLVAGRLQTAVRYFLDGGGGR